MHLIKLSKDPFKMDSLHIAYCLLRKIREWGRGGNREFFPTRHSVSQNRKTKQH